MVAVVVAVVIRTPRIRIVSIIVNMGATFNYFKSHTMVNYIEHKHTSAGEQTEFSYSSTDRVCVHRVRERDVLTSVPSYESYLRYSSTV